MRSSPTISLCAPLPFDSERSEENYDFTTMLIYIFVLQTLFGVDKVLRSLRLTHLSDGK